LIKQSLVIYIVRFVLQLLIVSSQVKILFMNILVEIWPFSFQIQKFHFSQIFSK